jgi:hypothetical protein
LAQERLDELTAEYLEWREREGREVGAPTSYRLPKVHAEMNFEFSELTATQAKLVFPRSSSSQTRSRDQKFSFDVVAVPPPPDMAEPSSRRLVLATDTARKRVFDSLRAAARSAPLQSKLGRAIMQFDKLKVLGLGDQHFVLFPTAPIKDVIKVSARGAVSVNEESVEPTQALELLFDSFVLASPKPDDGRALVDDVKAAARKVKGSNFEQDVESLLAAAERLERRFPDCEDAQPIASFFKTVANSLVEAQRRFDLRSVRYLAGGPLLPTTFRIPSLHAEMSFAVETTRGNRIKARLFRSGEEHREQSKREQRLEFDIHATPLEPGYVRSDATVDRTLYTITHAPVEFGRVLEPLRERDDGKRLIELVNAGHAAILRSESKHVLVAREPDDPLMLHFAFFKRLDQNKLELDTLLPAASISASHAWLFEGWLP